MSGAARIRWWIVVPAIALGVGALFGVRAELLYLASPEHAFAAGFDTNAEFTEPAVAPVLRQDPKLRESFMARVKPVYLWGGWSAADVVLQLVADSNLKAYASDADTNACTQAWAELYRHLLANPHQCRLLMDGRSDEADPRILSEPFEHMRKVCGAAVTDGARIRKEGGKPDIMEGDSYMETWRRLQPQAVNDVPEVRDDFASCTAKTQYFDAILALGPAKAARFRRGGYSIEAGEDYRASFSSAARVRPPPAEFKCAPAGTVFTMSMFRGQGTPNGVPITWTSLGQEGFDCKMRSSATGERLLWHDAASELPFWPQAHTLRDVWPLQAGKTAHFSYHPADDDGYDIDYRVLGFDQYWFPWGRVGAWAIEDDVRMKGGAQEYRMTEYWAPSLGWKVGQKVVSLRGPWPENVSSPDFQVIAVQKPPG
jgi:hypothetical protein